MCLCGLRNKSLFSVSVNQMRGKRKFSTVSFQQWPETPRGDDGHGGGEADPKQKTASGLGIE